MPSAPEVRVLAQADDDVGRLGADLADDGVAVEDDAVDVEALTDALGVAREEVEDLQVVVLDAEPAGGAEALANDLADATGGTVLVYTPSTVAAASRSRSDSEVEEALASGSLADPESGVVSFAEAFDGGLGVGSLLVLGLVAAVPLALAGRWWERRRRTRADEEALAGLAAPVREELDTASALVLDLDGQTLVAGEAVDATFRELAADYRAQRDLAATPITSRDEGEERLAAARQLVEDLQEVKTAVDTAARQPPT